MGLKMGGKSHRSKIESFNQEMNSLLTQETALPSIGEKIPESTSYLQLFLDAAHRDDHDEFSRLYNHLSINLLFSKSLKNTWIIYLYVATLMLIRLENIKQLIVKK